MKQCNTCFRFNSSSTVKCVYCDKTDFSELSLTAKKKYSDYKILIKDITIDGNIYKIEGLINRGGCATIIELTDKTGYHYALKVPFVFDRLVTTNKGDPDDMIQTSIHFLNKDIRTLKKLSDAMILKVFSTGNITLTHDNRTETFPYILMEMANTTAWHIIENEKLHDLYVPFTEKLKIIRDFILSLKSLHDLNVLHRDISPKNLFAVNRGDEIKYVLSDFGTSKHIDDTTKSTHIMAAEPYIDPQCHIDASFRNDERRDIWSAGVVIFEVLSGNFWTQSIGILESRKNIKFEKDVVELVLKPSLDERLYQILVKMVHSEISLRYPHVDDMFRDLLDYLDSIPKEVLKSVSKSKTCYIPILLRVDLPLEISSTNPNMEYTVTGSERIELFDFRGNDYTLIFPNHFIEKAQLSGTNLVTLSHVNNKVFLHFNQHHFDSTYKPFYSYLKNSIGHLQFIFVLTLTYLKV